MQKMLNAISVDVEDYFHVAAFDGAIDRNDWHSFESRVRANTHSVLSLFESKGIKGTFFVLGLVAEQFPSLIREIVNAGHELACHGYSHKKIYTQTESEFRAETRRSKKLLEDLSGQRVLGYRAASFSITSRSLWALDVLVEEGFEYDSSIFPVKHDNYGIPGADYRPSLLTTPSGNKIAELPMSTFSLAGFRIPVGGGGYFRLYPYWLTSLLLKGVNKAGRGFVFYCHPWELDVDQPRIDGASMFSRFRHYNNLHRFEKRLSRLIDEFPVDTCGNVLKSGGFLQPPSNGCGAG